MSFREKFISVGKCYLRSACKTESDQRFVKSLFESDWEVFVVKRDPATGTYRGHTLCCDHAPISPRYETKFSSAACA